MNPNSLNFLPGKKISNINSNSKKTKLTIFNKNILSLDVLKYLWRDFLSVNKDKNADWKILTYYPFLE